MWKLEDNLQESVYSFLPPDGSLGSKASCQPSGKCLYLHSHPEGCESPTFSQPVLPSSLEWT
ncbi:mCG147823 [Mus musculus]|nr:mCG147823 [Mus musculus]